MLGFDLGNACDEKNMVGVTFQVTPTFLSKTWASFGQRMGNEIFLTGIAKFFSAPQKHKTRSAQGIAGFEIW